MRARDWNRGLGGRSYERWYVVWFGGADYKINRYKVERTVDVHLDDHSIVKARESIELTPDRICDLFLGCLKDGNLPSKDKMADVAHQMHAASMEAWDGDGTCLCHDSDSPCPLHTGELPEEVTP